MIHRKALLKLGIFLLCYGSVAAGQPGAAGDWPRFRGPNGTGIAADKDIPVQWAEKDGVLWKTALPGAGNSSPIVWGNRVFLQSAHADKDRLLLCLNAADGKILWSRAMPGSTAHMHKKNTPASSTPATDGERVYALFWSGTDLVLAAHDFEGKLAWKRELGTFASQHGAGASPIVCAGNVILNNDQDGTAALLAFDARTGKDAWRSPRTAFRACYSTPFQLEQPGAPPELIVASTAGIAGFNPRTGAENWHWSWTFPAKSLRTVASPVYSQGLIVASSGDGAGDRHTVAVKKGTKGEVAKNNLVWENNKTFPYVPTMLAWQDHLYFVNDRGLAGCVVAKTGEIVWSERLNGTFSASPILIDGKIYAVNEDGDVFVYPAEPTYKLLAKNTIGERVLATPAVADGRLFVRGQNNLFCIGRSKDK